MHRRICNASRLIEAFSACACGAYVAMSMRFGRVALMAIVRMFAAGHWCFFTMADALIDFCGTERRHSLVSFGATE